MTGLTLHPMKEIRIIIQGEHVKFASDWLDRVKATGYTIFPNISGKGHHGFHTAHPMFNEMDSPVMLVRLNLEVSLHTLLRILIGHRVRENPHSTSPPRRRSKCGELHAC